MDAPTRRLLGVANGANPLVVVVPEFDVRKIGQSNPLAGGSNTITVTIQSNVNLAQATDSSVVTISGLTNAPDAASLGLTSVESSGADLFSDGSNQGKGALSSGTLTLTVHTGQTVAAGTQYAFSFTITNPASEQTFATPTIAASGTASFATSRGAMSTDIADRYGVADGGKPMTVIVPSLSVKSIGQSTPLAGATVTISVTLTANVDFPNDSTVTIVGLTGTQTTDSGSLAVTSTDGTTSGLMESSGGWTQSTGTLELTAGITGTAQGAACTITFDLQQASAEYTPPTVSIAAAINNGSTALGSIGQAAMVAPNSPLLGVANGADPLLVVVPEFDVRKIGQSNPLAGGSNTITVTIQSNVNLAQATDSSVVTISGLTNAPDAASLGLTSVESSGADLFSDGSNQGKGALSSGTLTLTVHTGQTVAAGTQYAFSFTITNPASEQTFATPTIAASGTASFATSRGAMSTDIADRYGVADGGKPMTVIVPSLSVKSIGQSTPLAGATVTISVTLTANVDFPNDSTVTIVGLTGTQTTDSGSLAVTSTDGTTSGLMESSGGWTQSTGTLELTAGITGTAQGAACTITFDLQQASAEYTPPTVSIAAAINNGSTALGSIGQAAMVAPNSPLLGVANGAGTLSWWWCRSLMCARSGRATRWQEDQTPSRSRFRAMSTWRRRRTAPW